jgi:GNAT superfamily N-acetyltransferase
MTTKIQRSDEGSLAQLEEWLAQEHEESDDGEFRGFYCNWGLIRKAHETGDLSVMIDGDQVIAFLAMDDSRYDIMEVRPDVRELGHGRKLARYYICRARQKNIAVMRIECSPMSSIPFWKKMDFIFNPPGQGLHDRAYMVLNKKWLLPNSCPAVDLSIAFYPESKKWEPQTTPAFTRSPKAARVGVEEIMLSERIICFDPQHRLGWDPVVGIEVDGKSIYLDKIKYLDKTKYSDAPNIGVQHDNRDNYFFDRIYWG